MVYWNVLALWEIEVSKVAAWYPRENQLETRYFLISMLVKITMHMTS